MSIIIKSNNTATNYLANSKMIGTTAQAEFEKYEQRVVADGGVISDTSRTLRAFEHLFGLDLYGSMNTFVSGTFGVKKSDGFVTKLYAIDGEDMIIDIRGSGSAPSLDISNALNFDSNSWADKTNGALFSTENPVKLSKVGSFAIGVTFKWADGERYDTGGQIIAAASSHNVLYGGIRNTIVDIKEGSNIRPQDMEVRWAEAGSDLTSESVLTQAVINSMHKVNTNPMMLGYVDNRVPERFGYRFGDLGSTIPQDSSEVFDVASAELYLDFGGAYNSTTHNFYTGRIYDFFSLNHCTKEQAQAFTRLTV